MNIKYQGTKIEKTSSGRNTSIVYYGTREEMVELESSKRLGDETGDGVLDSVSVSQADGPIWECELKYSRPNGDDQNEKDDPDNLPYGQKSAKLSCGVMSVPLEANKEYRANWNYFLAMREGASDPGWWESAKDCCGIDSKKYRWIKSPSDLPTDIKEGKAWIILHQPTMPGVETYDLATYQISESARFPLAHQAAASIVGKLNRVVDPSERFGLKSGIWKCDSAEVSWNGKFWLASLTFTASGDDSGWNKKLYDTGH